MVRREDLYVNTAISGEQVLDYFLRKYAQPGLADCEFTTCDSDKEVVADVGYWDGDYPDSRIVPSEKRINIYIPFYLCGWDFVLIEPDIWI